MHDLTRASLTFVAFMLSAVACEHRSDRDPAGPDAPPLEAPPPEAPPPMNPDDPDADTGRTIGPIAAQAGTGQAGSFGLGGTGTAGGPGTGGVHGGSGGSPGTGGKIMR